MVATNFSSISREILDTYKSFPDKTDFIPVSMEGNCVYFWVCSDEGMKKADYLCFLLDVCSVVIRKNRDDILKAMDEGYSWFSEEETPQKDHDHEMELEIEYMDNILESSYTDAPIVKLVNQTIIKGVKESASDIHFEPERDYLCIRFRIDGVLSEHRRFSKKIHDAVISRIKVMAELDVAETRRPQDGAMRVNVGPRVVDIRVSIIPSINGEKAVLRILDTSKELLSLTDIGLTTKQISLFNNSLASPNGIILVSGPTGSGKTTTLYAALKEVATKEKNIITIEDPIEYRMDGITQVQVNSKIGLTFDSALKYFLRQDPDVILVGEIRDVETAKTAITASLTGHLVLSTIHTNNASTTLARLIDMGVEPFLLSSSILLVIGQRLVRRVCTHCKDEVATTSDVQDMLAEYGIELSHHIRGRGCERCRGTGFSGRIGIFEFMQLTEPIKSLILKKGDAKYIEKAAIEGGMSTMLQDGINKVRLGITTPEEVLLATKL